MAITYIKKAEKTAFTGEDETRTKVSKRFRKNKGPRG